MTDSVVFEVWIQQPLRRCKRPCAHCRHNARRPMRHWRPVRHSWQEVIDAMPRGRRMEIRQWYCRYRKARLVQVRYFFRNIQEQS